MKGNITLFFNGEDKGIIHSNIPTNRLLYFCGRVCGHDSNAKITIMNDDGGISVFLINLLIYCIYHNYIKLRCF